MRLQGNTGAGVLPAVIFPDTELWACQYLKPELDARPEAYTEAVYVGNVVPETRTDRMVIVRRDGGPRQSMVWETARLTVRVWGSSEQEATDLARMVGALLWAAPTGEPIIRVTQPTGPTPVPDESRQPLRLQTFELLVRGTDLDQAVVPPPGPNNYATTAVAGKPGYFLPQAALSPPTLADMTGVLPVPASKWKGAEFVVLGDGSHATWNGSGWQ